MRSWIKFICKGFDRRIQCEDGRFEMKVNFCVNKNLESGDTISVDLEDLKVTFMIDKDMAIALLEKISKS